MSTTNCECGKPIKHPVTGECSTCYQRRWYREHRANPRPSGGSTLGPCTYTHAHVKVARWRGKAAEHPCLLCDNGTPAEEWSYRGGSEYEQTEERIQRTRKGTESRHFLSWSPDINAYDPLCKPHHLERDRGTA
ncbi:hypothetical protein [Herbiconiux sp. VKM Ac-2851]|uniref:hypothetical protein n=1 Tax=Herbiconiux sp. VKM Ac-2851 TaxID=2739025 RepID=UPI0015645141|nr:hypothetical protein [Herbiconiux sp. VKM Ac-2851]NQX34044.1 hypothetical protein [Herbiconiux sp. VKM Ac-2851]